MLEVLARSFLGRCVRWTGESFRYETPNILLISGTNANASAAEAVIELDEGLGPSAIRANNVPKMDEIRGGVFVPLSLESQFVSEEDRFQDETPSKKDVEIVVLEHSFEMRRDARAFVNHLKTLRGSVGPAKLIYAPGMMDLSNMALLAYMGIDLFDSALISYHARRGFISLPEGTISVHDAEWLTKEATTGIIEDLNLHLARKELGLIRHMIHIGRLRELAEIRANSYPWGVAAMRLLTLDTMTCKISCCDRPSLL
jgi:archaeosine synthase